MENTLIYSMEHLSKKALHYTACASGVAAVSVLHLCEGGRTLVMKENLFQASFFIPFTNFKQSVSHVHVL